PDVLVGEDEFVEFELYGEDAKADWGRQVPKGTGLVRLGDYRREFVVVVRLELHCLTRLVWAINDPSAPKSTLKHSGHCLIYIRHRVLCDADLTLEIFDPLELELDSSEGAKEATPPHVCKAWTKMLEELRDDLERWENSDDNLFNQREHWYVLHKNPIRESDDTIDVVAK
ncbi:hypothetical protein SCHPADRAFT_837170, partial [Schizopora paradoxa]